MTATSQPRVLIIGATGLLGRPVTRHLVRAGFPVTAMVRSPDVAAARLPSVCRIVEGNLRDEQSIEEAVRDVDAIYLSTSNPMSAERPEWDPDSDGVRTVIEVAKRCGPRHILRLSAMGVEDAAADWWVAQSKAETDQSLVESGLDYTVFRPTWFMESIAISRIGPVLIDLPGADAPIHWIAAEDYARQVASALVEPAARRRTFEIQGPEPVTMVDAFRRFAAVWRKYLIRLPLPRGVLAAGAPLSGSMSYLKHLIEYTYEHVVRVPAEVNGHELHRPTISIDDFARLVLATGDFPVKRRS